MLLRSQLVKVLNIRKLTYLTGGGWGSNSILGQGRQKLGQNIWQFRLAQTSSSTNQVAAPSIESFQPERVDLKRRENSGAMQLDFSSHSFAFKHKKTSELLRGYFVLRACAIDFLVNHSYRLLTVGARILGEKLLSVFVSPFYNQFVAGDTKEELAVISTSLSDVNVKLMIAPMLETDVGEGHDLEAMYKKNLDKTLYLIQLSGKLGHNEQTLPICQTKHTAHLSADVLARISTSYTSLTECQRADAVQILAKHLEHHGRKNFKNSDTPTFQSTFSVGDTIKDDHISLDFMGLSQDDHKQLLETVPRLYAIGEKCVKDRVILAVDAEYTYTNPAINLLTLAMMKVFNRPKQYPLIWNTYQGYLKAGRQNLEHDLRIVKSIGDFGFGAKIVRGAYLERERSWAVEENRPDPVNDTYEDTSAMYNSMVDVMLNEVKQDPTERALIVASHNEASVKLAANKIEGMGLDPHTGNVVFGQVYGMAENITLPLAHSGFLVYKSVPYGSMTEVMPYLSRRANENRAVLMGARKERDLLVQEIRSRMFSKKQ